jgi:hypothetical protein
MPNSRWLDAGSEARLSRRLGAETSQAGAFYATNVLARHAYTYRAKSIELTALHGDLVFQKIQGLSVGYLVHVARPQDATTYTLFKWVRVAGWDLNIAPINEAR